ncbi:MAG: dihydrodipicolinate synthase family protein [Chloroflexota bacterium]
MPEAHPLSGVYAAAITPVDEEYKPDLDAIQKLMAFYSDRGCHGALILGTTGEGPSFSSTERLEIMQAAAEIKKIRPEFRLFAGTGTPGRAETIGLNQAAFELGYDAVVVLPPFYFRSASDAGLLEWFGDVIKESVPEDKLLLGYHIPQVSGVALSVNLLQQLNSRFPTRLGGVKDSEGKLETTQGFTEAFPDKLILVGSDRLLSSGLEAGASGSITALANLIAPWLRKIFDQHGKQDSSELQAKVDTARNVLEQFAPFPPSIKFLIDAYTEFPAWPVLPPLLALDEQRQASLKSQFDEIYKDE